MTDTQHEAAERVSELKPCPFCGLQDVELTDTMPLGMYWVVCLHCGVQGECSHHRSEAIAAWNLRAHDAGQAGVVSEAAQVLVDNAWESSTQDGPLYCVSAPLLEALAAALPTPPKPSLFGDALAAAPQSAVVSESIAISRADLAALLARPEAGWISARNRLCAALKGDSNGQ